MKRSLTAVLAFSSSLCLIGSGCSGGKSDPQAEAPPPLKVERVEDRNLFQVDHAQSFDLVQATEYIATPQLRVTGTVNPDISRAVPVISLAVGRVVEIDARLGDTVKKGQLLLKVQSADISAAFSDYQKAVADEQLVRTQLDRAKLLYDKGAISLNDLQIAQDTEDKAKVDVQTTAEKLRVLGSPALDRPTGVIEIRAPISGVITDQQVTNAAGVAGLGSPNPFTISDLEYIWVLCDVYENDLANVRLGEKADIRLNAYPDQVFPGTIQNIGPVMDPNIRAAKVRLEMRNPGLMRPGMFVSATFHSPQKQKRAAVNDSGLRARFRRTEVVDGDMLPGGMQEVVSGLSRAE
jgi:cobalt-zinc-cadmium efflux system membrane fusion protein